MALAHTNSRPIRRRHLTLVPLLSETETETEPTPYGADVDEAQPVTIPTFDGTLPVQVQRTLRAAECLLWLPHLLAQLPERCPEMNPVRRYAADALTHGRLRDAAELYTRLYRYLADIQGGDPTGGQGPRPDPLGTPTVLPIRLETRP